MTGPYRGKCHCGNLAYTVTALPERVTICNCSICRRYGAVWGYYRREEVTLEYASAGSTCYRWNDEVINFVHCRHCGCLTHYEDVAQNSDSRVAVNFRMCTDAAWTSLNIRYFDGAGTFREVGDTALGFPLI